MKSSELKKAADQATALLKSLANRNRLMLLCHMAGDERSVGELAGLLPARDAAVSQQLALLRKDGLVSTRRDGQTVYYSLASEDARRVIDALYQIYCRPKAKRPRR